MSTQPTPTRKINVVSAIEVHSGTSDSGREWHLYEIVATTPEGEPIDLKLKSFERLDGLVDVEVEKQTHERFGDSYMLKPVGGGGGGGGNPGARLGPKVDELRGRIERLESWKDNVSSELEGLRQLATQAAGGRVYGQPPPPAPPAPPEEEEDIPF
jgi:hypothetical protein